MKKQYSEQQIVYALKQSELGETAADICHAKKSGHIVSALISRTRGGDSNP
jgi:hypothetical protein